MLNERCCFQVVSSFVHGNSQTNVLYNLKNARPCPEQNLEPKEIFGCVVDSFHWCFSSRAQSILKYNDDGEQACAEPGWSKDSQFFDPYPVLFHLLRVASFLQSITFSFPPFQLARFWARPRKNFFQKWSNVDAQMLPKIDKKCAIVTHRLE